MILEGKTALIIGGSRGIGRAVAEEFLKEGANIFIAARDQHELRKAFLELEKTANGKIGVIIADISKPNTFDYVIKTVKAVFGGLDILVNSAAVHGEIGLFHETDISEWEKTIEVDFFGTARAIRAVLPEMIKQGHGKIINFSGGGATSPRPYFSAYSASKTAIVRLTETIAEEMQELGISIDINAIAPGAVNTRLVDEIISKGPERVGQKEYELAVKRKTESGDDPKKAAALAVFLASSLSNGLTGRLISAIWDNWRDIPAHLTEIMDSDVFTLRRITPRERGYGW